MVISFENDSFKEIDKQDLLYLIIDQNINKLRKTVKKNKEQGPEIPQIIKRKDRDDIYDTQIKPQYDKTVGDTFIVEINGKKITKIVDVLPYFADENFSERPVEEIYQRIIIHHTAMGINGDAISEAKSIRNLEMGSMGFNDIGYHFIIASDGTILSGRPWERMGAHAGTSIESEQQMGKSFPKSNKYPSGKEKIYELQKSDPTEYRKRLRDYINIMKKDPDYGSLGIVLCGNFDNGGKPTQAQLDSLQKLLDWTKYKLHIPTDNIIFHNEVEKKVQTPSGYTRGGEPTVCPGKDFNQSIFSSLKNNLSKDTDKSKIKKIAL